MNLKMISSSEDKNVFRTETKSQALSKIQIYKYFIRFIQKSKYIEQKLADSKKLIKYSEEIKNLEFDKTKTEKQELKEEYEGLK